MPANIPSFFVNLITAQWCHTPQPQTATFDSQTVIVTGANTGLGFEAAKYAVTHNCARLIIACRSVDKGEKAKGTLEQDTGRKGVIEVWQLDLGSYDSIKAFVAKAQSLDRLDVLISNAGINKTKWEIVNGMESMIAVNVVSTFLHALMLLPKLRDTAAKYNTTPHLVIVSSDVHWLHNLSAQRKNTSTPVFEQLEDQSKNSISDRYPLSKLLDVLMTAQLASHLGQDYPVIVNTVNPGLCESELMRDYSSVGPRAIKKLFAARPTDVGARNHIYAATAGRETHGRYISETGLGNLSPNVKSGELEEVAGRIWLELVVKIDSIVPGTMAGVGL